MGLNSMSFSRIKHWRISLLPTNPLMGLVFLLGIVSLIGCSDEADIANDNAGVRINVTSLNTSRQDTDATFLALDGTPLAMTDFSGQRVFLNYWATWCAPCIREIPAILRAAAMLAEENYLFLLASDESITEIQEFLDDYGFDGNFIKLNGYFAAMGVQAVPSSVLYDENGEVLKSWLGEREWDSPEILSELRNP
jgi:thiol-disulfide isomerase/thioredoxin